MNCSPSGFTKNEKLGLPPMQLAESQPQKGYCTKFLDLCLTPCTRNIIGTIILAAIVVVTYLMIIGSIQDNEGGQTKLIILGVQDPQNINTHNGQIEILFKYENKTSLPYKIRRRRRSLIAKHNRDKLSTLETILADEDMIAARKTILNHNKPCHNENKDTFCKDFVTELKSISKRQTMEDKPESFEFKSKTDDNRPLGVVRTNEDHAQTTPMSIPRQAYGNALPHPSYAAPSYQPYPLLPSVQPSVPILTPPLADTCLLARLLKHSVPHVHAAVYDVPTEYLAPQYGHVHQQAPMSYPSYAPSAYPAYHQNRDATEFNEDHRPHPQDIEISRQRHTTERPNRQHPHTPRDSACPSDTLSCDDGGTCLRQKQWCDGNVDCADASDEARCTCVSRVDSYRLCDGYFDCPFGEDEMGCYGCSADAFSCEDLDLNSHSTCFSKEQRCDNVINCPNQRDEADCNLLSSSLHQQPTFAVSNTEGFLQRNFKGDWYPVCSNPYMWAHDACRRETGLIIRPPFIQMIHINPLLKVTYLNTNSAGALQTSDSCDNSSAVYVTCPDLLCGTRVFTTPQLLRENAAFENRLFGRNKRFLLQDLSYPVIYEYFGSKRKRHVQNITDEIDGFTKIGKTRTGVSDNRVKRAESRVVGGKPSQPAAWPWMIAMYRDGKFHCGGVVLNRRWVISAAHCVQKFWEHYYEIQIGMLRRFSFSPQEHSLRVTHVIVNQDYDRVDMKNDLCMLRVDPEIQFSRWVRPICLPGAETAGPEWQWGPQAGTVCVAVGWGSTEEHGPDPDHIREVEVPVWSKCKHKEDRAGNEICAGLIEGGKDACQGDSGGPLLCRNPLNSAQWYMAGIVSHGDGCGRKDEPGVYTRVSLYVKWIKHHISSSLPSIKPQQECPGFKCLSGISKCLPKDKRCDKIVDCLDGEDEMNCNFARNTDSFIVDLLTGNQGRNSEKEYLQSKEAHEKDKLGDILPTNEQTSTLSHEDISGHSKASFRDASEEVTEKTTIQHNEMRISRGDLSSSEDLHTSPSHFEQTSRETDVTEDWSEFIQTTQPVNIELETINTVTEEQTTSVTSSTEKDTTAFTNKNPKTVVIETSTPLTETTATIDKDHTVETSTEIVIHNSFIMKNNTEDKMLEISIPKNSHSLNFSSLQNQTKNNNLTATKDNSNHSISSLNTKGQHNTTSFENEVKHILFSAKDNDTIKAKLLPAINKISHRIPEHFRCSRINQMIPFKLRCDHKADCEDGSDEVGCTCVDYITTFDLKLICDGIVDCADGQDELNCFGCDENQFLCKKSKFCMPMKHVCDGRLDCPNGEDEFDCYTLTDGMNIVLDIDGRPSINLEGFLTKKQEHNWNIVCEDNLTLEQQEAAASHVCRYLGFSSANRLLVKYINVKEHENLETKKQDSRKRRDKTIPIQFSRQVIEDNIPKHKVIRDVQIIKEECVPNITKTCMSLYVFCEHTLFSDLLHFDIDSNDLARSEGTVWPWIAKIYVEGIYKCTGILIDVSWVLVSHSCLFDSLTPKDHTTVILGTQRVLRGTHGPYEQIYQVVAKKEWLNSKVTLLHLKRPAHYTSMVKPMAVSAFMHDGEKDAVCLAIGEDSNNNTVTLYLEETHEDCRYPSRCFRKRHNSSLCQPGATSNRQWSGVISCHGNAGWHPSASFVASRGECGVDDVIVATDIGNLRSDIKHYLEPLAMYRRSEPGMPTCVRKTPQIETQSLEESCAGVRCARGRCVSFEQLCNGIRDCEDGVDETEPACEKKHSLCESDPYHGGCECASGQLKCRNGRCLPKELFSNGVDDCGDGSDEPGHVSCAQYLARTTPSRLCDGVLHCQDRSDEDPMFCKCFAKKSVPCGHSDQCVSPDVVCDGVRDCPHGEDEQTCLALSSKEDTAYGTGMVISCSHGIWHTKCYTTETHTRTELEQICRKLGFISGHAQQLPSPNKYPGLNIKVQLEEFQEVPLNNNTKIKLRSSDNPLARAIFDNGKEKCYPVFIECL